MAQTDLTPSEHADKLGSVVDALAEKPDAFQATIATATILRFVADRKYQLEKLTTRIETAGTAGQTDVDLKVNGSTVLNGPLVTDNAETDPVLKSSVDFIDAAAKDIAVGDLVEVEVTAAPTAGVHLYTQVKLLPQFD